MQSSCQFTNGNETLCNMNGICFRNETLCCMTGMSFYISVDIIACVKEF